MQDILDRGPVIVAAFVLVASVAAFRMWRGHPWDEAIGQGVLWLCGVAGALIVFGVSIWLTDNFIATFLFTGLFIAWFVLRSHRRAERAASLPRCGKGWGPCQAG